MTNVVNSSVKRLILIFIILLYGCPGNITKPDEAPIFLNGIPTAETTTTKIGETHTVRGIAEDPDGDSFQYKTLKDGVKVNNTNEYTFTIDKKGITKIEIVAYNALSDTLTRNFSAENQAPVAQNKTISILEEETKSYNESELGSDPDGDTLEYRIISENNVDAKFENNKLIITGIKDYFGNANVSYEVSDGDKKANGTITLNITNVDDPPTATNVTLTPLEAFVGNTMTTSNGYYDVEGDLQGGIEINKYVNGVLAGSTGETTETNDLATGDKIKTGVIVYDVNGVEGAEVFSNEVTLQASPYRTISGIIIEYWSQTPDENVLVKTSIEEILTNTNGEYSLLASIEREDVLVLKEGRLESGYVLMPGTNDETINHEISDDTQENGIDRWLFKNFVLKKGVDENGYGRSDIPPEGAYVALTEESVSDTTWILGHVAGPLSWTTSFQNLDQINLLGKKINETANEATDGLYNVNRTTILVADENYANAVFDYPNMKAVPNSTFPANNEEQYKDYFIIAASQTNIGLNATFYKNDNVTIDGHIVILMRDLNLDALNGVFNTEFYASIMGGLETPDGYGSVFDPVGREITSHDIRLTTWNIKRGPGHLYPDFPANFKVEYVEEHNDN